MKAINLLRKYNFKGKGRLANFCFPSFSYQGEVDYNGLKILVDTRELIGWNVFWFGDYEKEVSWILEHVVQQGDVCVDVGANIGIYTLKLSSQASKVISVEPHPEFYHKLKSNVKLNNLKNIDLKNIALTLKKGQATLYAPNKDMSNKTATLKNVSGLVKDQNVEIKVETLSLDTLCKNESCINFIKVDTDWSDAEVLLSGKKTLSKHRPVILLEDLATTAGHGGWEVKADTQPEYKELYNLLKSLNYELFWVDRNKLVKNMGVEQYLQNCLAVPSESSLISKANSLL